MISLIRCCCTRCVAIQKLQVREPTLAELVELVKPLNCHNELITLQQLLADTYQVCVLLLLLLLLVLLLVVLQLNLLRLNLLLLLLLLQLIPTQVKIHWRHVRSCEKLRR